MKKIVIFLSLILMCSLISQGCEFLVERDTGRIDNVKADGHVWGSGESNSLIYSIVKCTDMSLEEGTHYCGCYFFDKSYMNEINLSNFEAGRLGLSYEGVFQCLFEIPHQD